MKSWDKVILKTKDWQRLRWHVFLDIDTNELFIYADWFYSMDYIKEEEIEVTTIKQCL